MSHLKAYDVVNALYNLSGGIDVALVCYERPQDFCHRHIVADWLRSNGIECNEYIYDAMCETTITDIFGNKSVIVVNKNQKSGADNI